MTTKNAMHYTGMVTQDNDDTDTISTNIEVPQPTAGTFFMRNKRCMSIWALAIFALAIVLILILTDRKKHSPSQTKGFDASQLYTLSRSGLEIQCVGCSKYPAILLYKRYSMDIFSSSNVDDIYGHIPHEWINCEASFLLVDQITKGVGM